MKQLRGTIADSTADRRMSGGEKRDQLTQADSMAEKSKIQGDQGERRDPEKPMKGVNLYNLNLSLKVRTMSRIAERNAGTDFTIWIIQRKTADVQRTK